jgi:hypothetical protein
MLRPTSILALPNQYKTVFKIRDETIIFDKDTNKWIKYKGGNIMELLNNPFLNNLCDYMNNITPNITAELSKGDNGSILDVINHANTPDIDFFCFVEKTNNSTKSYLYYYRKKFYFNHISLRTIQNQHFDDDSIIKLVSKNINFPEMKQMNFRNTNNRSQHFKMKEIYPILSQKIDWKEFDKFLHKNNSNRNNSRNTIGIQDQSALRTGALSGAPPVVPSAPLKYPLTNNNSKIPFGIFLLGLQYVDIKRSCIEKAFYEAFSKLRFEYQETINYDQLINFFNDFFTFFSDEVGLNEGQFGLGYTSVVTKKTIIGTYSLLIRAVLIKIDVESFEYNGLSDNMNDIDNINRNIVKVIEQNIGQTNNLTNDLVKLLDRRRELIKPIQKYLKEFYKSNMNPVTSDT